MEKFMNKKSILWLAGSLIVVFSVLNPAQAAVDTAKAEELVLANKCGKCHDVVKTKAAPPF